MKKIFFTLAMVLVSSAALADQSINLSSGSSARLNVGQPTFVSCQGSRDSETLPACKIYKSVAMGAGYYDLSVGDNVLQTNVYTLDSALAVLNKLRSSGLCN